MRKPNEFSLFGENSQFNLYNQRNYSIICEIHKINRNEFAWRRNGNVKSQIKVNGKKQILSILVCLLVNVSEMQWILLESKPKEKRILFTESRNQNKYRKMCFLYESKHRMLLTPMIAFSSGIVTCFARSTACNTCCWCSGCRHGRSWFINALSRFAISVWNESMQKVEKSEIINKLFPGIDERSHLPPVAPFSLNGLDSNSSATAREGKSPHNLSQELFIADALHSIFYGYFISLNFYMRIWALRRRCQETCAGE